MSDKCESPQNMNDNLKRPHYKGGGWRFSYSKDANWKHPNNKDENWKRRNNKRENWKPPNNKDENWKHPYNQDKNFKRSHNRNENWKPSHDTNTKAGFEKTFRSAPRHPLNYWRRPFFASRRRGIMAGRYPNQGFNQHAPGTYRPNCPAPQGISPGLRHPFVSRPAGMSAPFVQRLPLLRTPTNTFDNKCNQYIPSAAGINEDQAATEFRGQNYESNDLWVESLAPGGKIYYYNMRTRESAWMKPINVRIIELNEINQLPHTKKHESNGQENSNMNVQQQPIHNLNGNAVVCLENFSTLSPRIPFPPNLRIPPPNFPRPTAENIQNKVASYNVGFVMPPPVVPVSVVPVVPNNVMNNGYNVSVTQNLLLTNNIVQYSCNNHPNMLQDNNIIEYNSNFSQDVLSNMCVGEFNLNVPQDVLLSCETDSSASIEQNMISNYEIVDHHENAMQNFSTSDEMVDENATDNLNLISNIKVIDYSSSDSDDNELEISVSKIEEMTYVQSKIDNPSSDTPVSNIMLSSLKAVEIDSIQNANEKSEQEDIEQTVKIKSESTTQKTKIEDSAQAEMKDEAPAKLPNKDKSDDQSPASLPNIDKPHDKSPEKLTSKNKPVNKSRPTSCTPIPGSFWCVVWTGDDRVFFYDSKRKISVWDRPPELLNRSDVNKLIERNPTSLGLKPLTKESRKTSDDQLDAIKKQKKSDEKAENSEAKKTAEDANVENIVIEKDTLEVEHNACSSQQNFEKFWEMLSDREVSAFSTWEQEVQKIVYDSKYLLLPANERKQVINEYIEKKSQEEIVRSQKEEFLSMLMEVGVTSDFLFCDVVHLCSEDARFVAIEDQQVKESVFNLYVSELKQKNAEREKLENKMKCDFMELLSENSCVDKKWTEVQEILADDERYKALQSDSVRVNLFKEYVQKKCLYASMVQKRESANARLKDSEENVKGDFSFRKKLKNENSALAALKFKAVLEDLIGDSIMSWKSASTVLEADQRLGYLKNLGPAKREDLFNKYIDAKKREQFHRLLDELPDLTIKTSWLDIRKHALKDPRCARFSFSERECEKEFKVYLSSKRSRPIMS